MSEISPAKVASPLPIGSSVNSTPVIQQNTIEASSNAKNAGSTKNTLSKRIEVETLVKDFKKKMGNNWDKYQTTISAFLIGRLSRGELTAVLSELLTDSKLVRMHNQLLLANLANALRDGPNSASANSGFGGIGSNKRKKDGRVKASSQYEKLKKDIMNLPIRERRRIKTITRESGKRQMANSALTLTRQSLLPKIPYVNDKDKNLTGNTVEWTQDISHGIQTLLSTETYSLPDHENLRSRMLGIAREHGLTGTVDKGAVDLVYIGLENYLKGIVEQAIDTVRYRKQKYASDDIIGNTQPREQNRKRQKVTLTNEDMVDTFELFPYLVEPSGPIYRLNGVQLNDDTYVEEKTAIDSILKPREEVFKTLKLNGNDSKTENSTSSPLIQQKTIGGDTNEPKIKSEIGETNNLINGDKSLSNNNSPLINGKTIGAGISNDANIGTKDELNWLIHDILSTH
ncbi:Transcriptional coactivator HFI1/ADA1 [Wickerhamomyces ciferrii]|uniref:Transcriptional coactivator HFI1/ADA1 n=1 Tax=Wickerhamomyces ciferrii (strain ATCC 14091 / BCRC 22168 / CBS 111 / JCM 3599 / NBRC 0793 / NRRL Y-1031 F-60-10) TaxID=1206466 RepID=K0KJ17_WICCF|nr:Transcriptional coactivator HFI1/ADA1 [Wickerhamomyces ciferrii]CCH41113.1 Transcriptional coactivator HFI1/ADA1 [Wickerhamomyces ciferrii]